MFSTIRASAPDQSRHDAGIVKQVLRIEYGRAPPNVKIGCWSRGVGKPGFPTPLPAEGFGKAQPSQEAPIFILFVCGGAAWTAEVTIVRRVLPPSQPPPAGGRSRVPAPSGGGSGKGLSPCPRSRGAGVPPALPGHVHWALCAMRMTV